jgi:hypothetical protein
MAKYMVFNIGCIECGVSSNVVGLFTDKAKADALAHTLPDTHGWREGGQNSFRVFELPEQDNVITEEYTKPYVSPFNDDEE